MTESDLTAEVWRTIEGFRGLYQVSNIGRIRRWRTHRKRYDLLNGTVEKTGYRRVKLRSGRGTTPKLMAVHRLVAAAFLGPIPNGITINHINAIKTDNRIENLEFATTREQIDHEMRMGLCPKGSNHGRAILTDSQVLQIRSNYRDGHKIRTMANFYGVSHTAIRFIVQRKNWRHI